MKKLLSILLCLVLVTGTMFMMTGCGDSSEGGENEDGIVIGYSNGVTGNAWRANQVDAVEAYFIELKEAGVIEDYIISNTNDVNAQIAGLTDMINKGVDAIVMNADAGAVLAPTMQTAINEGIIVVGTGVEGIELSPQNVIAESENYNYYQLATEYLAYEMGYKGDVVHLYGLEGGWPGGELRKAGVKDTIAKYDDMEIIAGAACNWIEADGNTAMASLLATYGDELSDVMIMGEDVSMGVLQAYEAADVDVTYINGEYTYGWLRTWQANEDIISCVGTYPADTAVTWVDIALLLMEGYEIDNDKLEQAYRLTIPMPKFIVREEPAGDEAWLEYVEDATEVITIEEELAGNEDKADNDTICGHVTKDQVKEMFFK